jgi:hypothetical protein
MTRREPRDRCWRSRYAGLLVVAIWVTGLAPSASAEAAMPTGDYLGAGVGLSTVRISVEPGPHKVSWVTFQGRECGPLVRAEPAAHFVASAEGAANPQAHLLGVQLREQRQLSVLLRDKGSLPARWTGERVFLRALGFPCRTRNCRCT